MDTKEPIINPKTGISVAVVVLMLGGGAANIKMVAAISEREAVVTTEVKAMRRDVTNIVATIREYTTSSDRRMEALRVSQYEHQIEMTRKLAALESELRVLRDKK